MRDGLKNRVSGNQYYLESNTLSQILSILPDITFQDGNPLLPTLEGQYIIKNIIIITAALIIGRSYLKIKFK